MKSSDNLQSAEIQALNKRIRAARDEIASLTKRLEQIEKEFKEKEAVSELLSQNELEDLHQKGEKERYKDKSKSPYWITGTKKHEDLDKWRDDLKGLKKKLDVVMDEHKKLSDEKEVLMKEQAQNREGDRQDAVREPLPEPLEMIARLEREVEEREAEKRE